MEELASRGDERRAEAKISFGPSANIIMAPYIPSEAWEIRVASTFFDLDDQI